jgi:hypothetical protein
VAMTTNRDHRGSCWHVVNNGATVDGNSVEGHQALANLRIGAGIDLTSLGIAEKVIEGFVSTLSVVVCSMLADIPTMSYAVVNWASMESLLLLLGLVVPIVASVMSLGVPTVALMELTAMIIVSGCGCCKVLQVSNYFAILGPVAACWSSLLVWRSEKDRVVCMSLDMLLQVLGTLEALAAEVTLVWLQRDVNTNVRRDVVALDCGGAAEVPSPGEVQIVGALASNMAFADMLVESLWGFAVLAALVPLTSKVVISSSMLSGSFSTCGSRHWPVLVLCGHLFCRTNGRGR